MPSLAEHTLASRQQFGKPYTEVHVWLDAFAGQPPHGMRHRRFRHHEAGIREAGLRFGPGAEQAARQHVMLDLMQEGWTPSDPFPRDETHYLKLGLF